jgi:hypothetical protein
MQIIILSGARTTRRELNDGRIEYVIKKRQKIINSNKQGLIF